MSSGVVPSSSHASRANGILSLIRLLLAAVLHFEFANAVPLVAVAEEDINKKTANDPQLWIYLTIAIALVLLGGAFAGLTIALMGQDEVYLNVIQTSSEKYVERKNAGKVLSLLKRGKHWVLVTLLVGNVITNETLPIVLDRSIGGGYAAAISSTVLVIVFGEIVPQSICVRYGLPIGAMMAKFVLVLMWIFAPITWPIAKLLDRLLGEDHGQTYNKPGLKTLVTLHKTMGDLGTDRLNEDEVAIISGVLDLKAKSVGSIMTPMNDVFTLSQDAVLDEEMMDEVMREGYSRIPIHEAKNKSNYIGMLLVKMLITYDPEDAKRVSEFSLATLPETEPCTSCLDIINFFQQGKSHMVLVSDFPGQTHGALGVVTLEDVIEELIGEEIIDESDVFVDVHKAIRRMHPAPTTRARHNRSNEAAFANITNSARPSIDGSVSGLSDHHADETTPLKADLAAQPLLKRDSFPTSDYSHSPQRKPHTFLMRRKTSVGSPASNEIHPVSMRGPEMRQQLRNLVPSNAASKPKSTRVSTVKIKPGVGTIPEVIPVDASMGRPEPRRAASVHTPEPSAAQGGIGQDLVSPGLQAKDGVRAVAHGYGSTEKTGSIRGRDTDDKEITAVGGSASSDGEDERGSLRPVTRTDKSSLRGSRDSSSHSPLDDRTRSEARRAPGPRETRSGSIIEQFVDTGGVKKLVLEATSSGEEAADSKQPSRQGSGDSGDTVDHDDNQHPAQGSSSGLKPSTLVVGANGTASKADETGSGAGAGIARGKSKKKKKKKKRGKGGNEAGKSDENTPLLER